MKFSHYPVMKTEIIQSLNIEPDRVYCDLTLGGGSHAYEIAKQLKRGFLIAVDRDAEAIEYSREKLKEYKDKIFFVKSNYVDIKSIAKNLGFEKIGGAIMDLGVSTHQIETSRGFSYIKDSVLDMRMDQDQATTAADVVNRMDPSKLKEILYTYGEERHADLIVRTIVQKRQEKPIKTTLELVDAIKYALRNIRYTGGNPAKRTFQAIRIFVNREIENIEPTLDFVEDMLESGGRLAVISFHSGEDREVKRAFVKYEKNCVCPPGFPVCVCGKKATSKIITKKPILPGREEIEINPPSASAKLRVLEKL